MYFRKNKIILIMVTAVFCSLLSFCMSKNVYAQSRVQQVREPVIVVIDPGHGGSNEGTTENGFLEKKMTMTTALSMYDELSKFEGVKIYMTHEDDADYSLKERAEYAEKVKADFLLSIHYNASIHHQLFGTEVWISSKAPYNAYGYQMGVEHQLLMQEMGLYSRGVKTKLNAKNVDYYGILRECSGRNIPAVILEHCHVDENRDNIYCDDEEELIAFGIADAHAVARYFGLRSEELGIDYSKHAENELFAAEKDTTVEITREDKTPPDVCVLELLSEEPEQYTMEVQVTACDYDTPLLYYSYSLDGGDTFSDLQKWPGSDAIANEYSDNFTLKLSIPEGSIPKVIFRAHNIYDLYTDSDMILSQVVYTGPLPSQEPMPSESFETATTFEEITPESLAKEPFWQEENEPASTGTNKIVIFLVVAFLILLFVFMIFFVYQLIYKAKKRKKHK